MVLGARLIVGSEIARSGALLLLFLPMSDARWPYLVTTTVALGVALVGLVRLRAIGEARGWVSTGELGAVIALSLNLLGMLATFMEVVRLPLPLLRLVAVLAVTAPQLVGLGAARAFARIIAPHEPEVAAVARGVSNRYFAVIVLSVLPQVLSMSASAQSSCVLGQLVFMVLAVVGLAQLLKKLRAAVALRRAELVFGDALQT